MAKKKYPKRVKPAYKSRVRSHLRWTPSGKVTSVKGHTRKRRR